MKNILLHWCIDFDLSHVGVAPILMVGQGCNLYHKCPDRSSFRVCEGNPHPAAGFPQFKQFDLLKIVKVISGPDGYLIWCVALVGFVVCVYANAVDCCFPAELDVDQMRLATVRLPICVWRKSNN